MSKLDSDTKHKNCKKYSQVSVKCVNNTVGGSNKITGKTFSRKIQRKTATRKERRKKSSKKKVSSQNTKREGYIKNLLNRTLTDSQISLISRGLKFIPVNKSINRNKMGRQLLQDFDNFARRMRLKYMFHRKNRDVHLFYGLKFIPVNKSINRNKMGRQLLQDFDNFARRMRLKYMFHRKNRDVHLLYVKSDWNPPVQPSVALESYLEEVKSQLAEIKITKPKNNL